MGRPGKQEPRTWTPDWTVSFHAESRLAKRFRLFLDATSLRQIAKALDDPTVRLLDIRSGSIRVYEIRVLGAPMIAVCNIDTRVVITFLKPERWNRHIPQRRVARRGRPKDDDAEEE